MKKDLPDVTLLGVDCVDIDRLVQAAEICIKNFNFAEIKLLTSLPSDGIENIVPIEPIETVEEYSEFAIKELSKYVNTSHVLIIQYDGFILNPSAWTDEYLKYDYIGSPWLVNNHLVKKHGVTEEALGSLLVGNGGFSLRSKKLLDLLADMSSANKIKEYHPEDVVICIKIKEELEEQGIIFAPADLAGRFGYEGRSSEDYAWTNEFGFHGLKWTDISKWISDNPEYGIKNPFDISML